MFLRQLHHDESAIAKIAHDSGQALPEQSDMNRQRNLERYHSRWIALLAGIESSDRLMWALEIEECLRAKDGSDLSVPSVV